jgi:hypothetical protein
LSWLEVQEQAVYLLDPETESEEELWARSIAKNGIDESTFAFADAIRARNMLQSEHGYYSFGSVDLVVEETTQHDWVSSDTVKQDGTSREEFRPQTNSLTDRPDENFFLGLAGMRFIEAGLEDRYTRINRVCSNCHIYTPKALVKCQNCED